MRNGPDRLTKPIWKNVTEKKWVRVTGSCKAEDRGEVFASSSVSRAGLTEDISVYLPIFPHMRERRIRGGQEEAKSGRIPNETKFSPTSSHAYKATRVIRTIFLRSYEAFRAKSEGIVLVALQGRDNREHRTRFYFIPFFSSRACFLNFRDFFPSCGKIIPLCEERNCPNRDGNRNSLIFSVSQDV